MRREAINMVGRISPSIQGSLIRPASGHIPSDPEMRRRFTQKSLPPDRGEVEGLLHTALWNTDGELVEGAFVDHWESYSHRAVVRLRDLYRHHGFTEADADRIREAIHTGPPDAVDDLLYGLDQWARPLVKELLQSPIPEVRAVCVRAARNFLPHDYIVPYLADPAPEVRLAAFRTRFERRYYLPGWEAHLVPRLGDPDPAVRAEAGARLGFLFLTEPAIAAAIANHLQQDLDPEVGDRILAFVAEEVRKAADTASGQQLLRRLDDRLRQLFFQGLDSLDPDVRAAVAIALGK